MLSIEQVRGESELPDLLANETSAAFLLGQSIAGTVRWLALKDEARASA